MPTNAEKKTLFEIFENENERIQRDAKTADAEARTKIRGVEKHLEQVSAKREKAAAIFEDMRARFERLEEEVQAEESSRIVAASAKKADVLSGKITNDEYYREEKTMEKANYEARAETRKKLDDLLRTVRAKGLEVLELDVEVATCEQELSHLRTFPTSFMLERMRAQLKALEQTIIANSNGVMPIWTELSNKKEALRRANGKSIQNHSWDLMEISDVKRLRFDAGIPESEIPRLNDIIAEMESRPGATVALRFFGMGESRGLSVGAWGVKRERKNR